ncbi:MAG: response regulator [Ignavibacteriaceae bacterium]|nr:response regulator [Ignavibacteriaceae bacterium]
MCKNKLFLFIAIAALLLCAGTGSTAGQQFADERDIGELNVTNYPQREYKAHNQNWDIVAGADGLLYIGNSAGLLEYDGIRWNLIPIKNMVVRSLTTDDNGTIYVGSYNDFGCIKINKRGQKEYFSLLENSSLAVKTIGNVWNVCFNLGRVFFITSSAVYIYEPATGNNAKEIKLIKAPFRIDASEKIRNEIIVYSRGNGLYRFDGSKFIFIEGSDYFGDMRMFHFFPDITSDRGIYFATVSDGLIVYDGQSFGRFRTEADGFIKKSLLYKGCRQLSDGILALGTQTGGMVMLDKSGKILRTIDTRNGLNDDGVLCMYEYRNRVWIGLENGIASFYYPSPVKTISKISGLKGSVNDLYFRNGHIYAGSTTGLLSGNINSGNKTKIFDHIDNSVYEVWSFAEFGDKLLAGTTLGLYEIAGDNLVLIYKGGPVYLLLRSTVHRDVVYQGSETGLLKTTRLNGGWKTERILPDLKPKIVGMAETNEEEIFLGTFTGEIIRIYKEYGVYRSQTINFPGKSDRPSESRVYSIDGRIYASSGSGFYFVNSNVMEEDQLTRAAKKAGYKNIIDLFYGPDGDIWLSGSTTLHRNVPSLVRKNIKGEYTVKFLNLLKPYLDFENENSVVSLFRRNDLLWLFGSDGIVSLNVKAISEPDTRALKDFARIRNIYIGADSLLFIGDDNNWRAAGNKGKAEIIYANNAIRFEFSSVNFAHSSNFAFSYKLDGFDEGWSLPSGTVVKEYTNLSPGSYSFKLKSFDLSENESDVAAFSFIILPPWYLTWYAYLIYTLLAAAAVYFITRWRFNYLVKRTVRLESIIGERTKLLQIQAEKLQQMDEMKSRFFTNISHEFRTPLTLILGQLESLTRNPVVENIGRKVEMAQRNARSLLNLINQLLEISKMEAGKLKLKVEPINIVKFTRLISYNFESFADTKGINLRFSSAFDKLIIYADKEKLERVIINLLSNAFKFTPEGGKIMVEVSRKSDYYNGKDVDAVVITVSDTGVGIQKELLPYIFDRFYRIENIDPSVVPGSGIGLSLVKELVELHHGQVEVESELGKGSRFTFSLLTGTAHFTGAGPEITIERLSDDTTDAESADVLFPAAAIKKIVSDDEEDRRDSVLIVEDNPDIREFISENLRDEYKILQAGDGEAGFEEAKESIPDLIITDIMMPKVDGLTFTKNIRADAVTSHIPVIILTAKVDEDDKLAGLEAGSNDYILKPFSSQELILKVKNLLKLRKNLREKYSRKGTFNPEEVSGNIVDRRFLEKVNSVINGNLADEKFSIDKIASEVNLSVSQLNRKLNSLIGQPAGQLVRTRRLETAAQMISRGEGSIKEISWNVGFSDQSNFTRSFKNHFGYAPSELEAKSTAVKAQREDPEL